MIIKHYIILVPDKDGYDQPIISGESIELVEEYFLKWCEENKEDDYYQIDLARRKIVDVVLEQKGKE